MRNLHIGLIGLGLIGGSVAKALRQTQKQVWMIAYDPDVNALKQAVDEGTLDARADAVDSRFSDCDYIFLCAPVQYNIANLSILKNVIREDCIITDVGSTKSNVLDEVKALGMQRQFIGGHPMAGSEKSGYQYAAPILLENAYYVLTPTTEVSPERVAKLKSLVAAMGAIPIVVTAQEHDFAVAAISHLPHLIAASLVNLVKDSDSEKGLMKMLAAGGFKDITRIASSSPVMWEQICVTNSENIVSLLEHYIKNLSDLNESLLQKNGSTIYQLFDSSRDYRNSFADRKSGLIEKINVIYCDIFDETGAIATIATLLAKEGLSIRNIGIVHNREHEEGVLRIEFYDEASAETAASVLKNNHYTVYKR